MLIDVVDPPAPAPINKYWPTPAESRALAAVPLYHKNAMAGAIKPMLSAGGSVVLLPNFEPRRFLRALAGYRCTHTGGVPAVFTLLLQERDLIESLDFSALKGVKIGSAPTPKELLNAVEAAFGVPASESYGLTEGGPVMIGPPLDGRQTFRIVGEDEADPRAGSISYVSPVARALIGKAVGDHVFLGHNGIEVLAVE
jgi:acyl-CoA synthetase (AMP-forming)/AMP-acid ligase II